MELVELYRTAPATFFIVLIVSLIITLLSYCAIPLIFAATRKTPITKRRYRVLCFALNLIVMIIFIAINGESISIGPYALWTGVFSSAGVKILNKKGYLFDEEEANNAASTASTAETALPPVIEEISELNTIVDEKIPATVEDTACRYCGQCGFKLLPDSSFCSACGSPVIKS